MYISQSPHFQSKIEEKESPIDPQLSCSPQCKKTKDEDNYSTPPGTNSGKRGVESADMYQLPKKSKKRIYPDIEKKQASGVARKLYYSSDEEVEEDNDHSIETVKFGTSLSKLLLAEKIMGSEQDSLTKNPFVSESQIERENQAQKRADISQQINERKEQQLLFNDISTNSKNKRNSLQVTSILKFR